MQKILSKLRKACQTYSLIEDGDKIAVGVSGGKDSLTLLYVLKSFMRFSPQQFTIEAIAVDMTGEKNDYSQIQKFCDELDVKLTIVNSDIFDVVFNKRQEKNPCSLCANLRRGYLNSTAQTLGCNKVALGHHKDDFIETFLMSLLFEGRLSTFKPKTYLSRTELTVIRPLIFCDEEEIKKASKSLPVLFNVCPVDKHTQRENIKNLLTNLQKTYPDIKEKIFASIVHTERYNLLNKE